VSHFEHCSIKSYKSYKRQTCFMKRYETTRVYFVFVNCVFSKPIWSNTYISYFRICSSSTPSRYFLGVICSLNEITIVSFKGIDRKKTSNPSGLEQERVAVLESLVVENIQIIMLYIYLIIFLLKKNNYGNKSNNSWITKNVSIS
jgi:hypothetical protein